MGINQWKSFVENHRYLGIFNARQPIASYFKRELRTAFPFISPNPQHSTFDPSLLHHLSHAIHSTLLFMYLNRGLCNSIYLAQSILLLQFCCKQTSDYHCLAIHSILLLLLHTEDIITIYLSHNPFYCCSMRNNSIAFYFCFL